ncbi:homeobox-leucine zipper protein HOX17-like isoform X1 [Musa acuminata AAA Group]|uniref:homeobox-leucine zipper protein HOX17-like isoform X1 n=1 Tax=Musa acuminata AAA Group TaxID=214697 RepID=UPI0031DB02E3
MCSSSITLHHFNHLNPTGSYAPPSSPHLTMQEEECNVSLSLAIGGVGDLPFIKNLDQTSFKEEKEEKRDGGGTRKKLRLSGEQLALLEDSFRAHSTLAPVRPETRACAEVALAAEASGSMVSEQESQVLQTKLKQTEVDCGFLRRCCERLANENRRLKRELMEMRSVVKPGPQLSIEHRKAARLRMCSSCEKMTSDEKESSLLSTINS